MMADLTLQDSVLTVVGEMTFATVSSLLAQSKKCFAQKGEFEINLHQVSRADSAGLVLLLAWYRLAKRKKLSLVYTNVPVQLLNMAKLCQLETLLPLQ
jgi:phospholipid transport system transporter-binding protein